MKNVLVGHRFPRCLNVERHAGTEALRDLPSLLMNTRPLISRLIGKAHLPSRSSSSLLKHALESWMISPIVRMSRLEMRFTVESDHFLKESYTSSKVFKIYRDFHLVVAYLLKRFPECRNGRQNHCFLYYIYWKWQNWNVVPDLTVGRFTCIFKIKRNSNGLWPNMFSDYFFEQF